jgi:hypothetical protein
MIMNTFEEVADVMQMHYDDFLDWIHSFKANYSHIYDVDWDTGEETTKIVYTDGDEGVMLVEKSSESNGLCIQLVGCSYVEIPPKLLSEIMKELK